MKKTSYAQFQIIVEFMESNGDLSKPTGGARGRQWCIKKWKELTELLNSEGSGKSQDEEKWHKVWSDFKNNTKRKWAKVNKSVNATGGGPSLKEKLTDLEYRVLAIIGEQAATGMNIPEAGFQQDDTREPLTDPQQEVMEERMIVITMEDDSDWNTQGTSIDPTPVPPSVHVPDVSPSASPAPTAEPTPAARPLNNRPRGKKCPKASSSTAKYFIEAEKNARELERDRDRMMYEIEREKLRLQAQWLEFMKECLAVVKDYLGKKGNE